ncbi:MAG: hypothetical protein HY906_19825 [Deltaproteobacteria bacterium]|nr:hypothetical protein [Deltaproteobacteria bacterium]
MIREGSIHLPFAYAAGPAASRFLVSLRDEGRILGSPCPACRRVLCPARSFCPRCGDETGEPISVGPAGTVVSFTAQAGGVVFGLVRLDGADTAMLHRLLGDGMRWTIGARVRPRLAARRQASITDIEGFEPLQEPGDGT